MSNNAGIGMLRAIVISALAMLSIGSAQAESFDFNGHQLELDNWAPSASRLKGMVKEQRNFLEYELPHRYMAAFIKQANADLAAGANEGGHHQQAATAYGAATAYTYGVGKGLDGSGLSHLGLNFLLGLGDFHKKNYYARQIEELGQFVFLIKVFDESSPEAALRAGMTELGQSWSEDWCGFQPRTSQAYYVVGQLLGVPLGCSKVGAPAQLAARTVSHYPGFDQLISSGFVVMAPIALQSTMRGKPRSSGRGRIARTP
jgi:hypothetical protein